MTDVRTAIIILNYNDNNDLFKLLPQLETQSRKSVIIIVDNASSKENREQICDWIRKKESFCIQDKMACYQGDFDKDKDFYLILNNRDAGFSGGNNVGLRISNLLDIEYALIISPDVRLPDDNYMEVMLREIQDDSDIVVAGSNILDINGRKQSPIHIITFKEEVLWFLPYLPFARKKNNVVNVDKRYLLEKEAIHGCCMLFDVKFMEKIGYLDERVFMYSEEPILAARVEKAGKRIAYIPQVTAIHEHIRSRKVNSSLRMKDYFKSRKYYINAYSDYKQWQKVMVFVSYGICQMMHSIKYFLGVKGNRR